jgi:hypothetical protein
MRRVSSKLQWNEPAVHRGIGHLITWSTRLGPSKDHRRRAGMEVVATVDALLRVHPVTGLGPTAELIE